MITVEIDEVESPEVARVTVAGEQPFKGTVPTRMFAENLLTNVLMVKGGRGEGWINLLGTPANTAWKFAPSGVLEVVTYFPPRVVDMQCVHPFTPDQGTRPFLPKELCIRPWTLPGSVWTGRWDARGTFTRGAFMLSAEPNPASFLDTPTSSFDYGNVHEIGGMCWGNATPTPAVGNLYALDRFFFLESVNNYHINRGPGRNWLRQVFGLANWDALQYLVRGVDARGVRTGPALQLPLSWEEAQRLLPNLPATVTVQEGSYNATIGQMLAG